MQIWKTLHSLFTQIWMLLRDQIQQGISSKVCVTNVARSYPGNMELIGYIKVIGISRWNLPTILDKDRII